MASTADLSSSDSDADEAVHAGPCPDGIDETDVPAFAGPTNSVKAGRPTYTLRSVAASIAAHLLIIASGWWAVGAGRLPLPTEGIGGENGELGRADTADLAVHQADQTSDAPLVFALPPDDSAQLPPSMPNPSPPVALDEARAFDPLSGAEPLLEDINNSPLKAAQERPTPLIGLGPRGISLPRPTPKLPPVMRPPAARSDVAVADEPPAAPAAAMAVRDASDRLPSEAAGGEAATASAVASEPTDGEARAAAAATAYTPARPAGMAGGGGRRGRRGASGLDGRGLPIPDYPPASRRRGEEGLVVLEVEVREDGSVGEIRVSESSGHRRLDEAAANAVRRAAFTPAMLGGRAVAGVVVVPYRFRLE